MNPSPIARLGLPGKIGSSLIAFAVSHSFMTPSAFAQSGSLFHPPVRTVSYQSPAANPPQPGKTDAGMPSMAPSSSMPPQGPAPFSSGAPQVIPGYGVANGGVYPPEQNSGLATSWTYIQPTQARKIRMHDIISIRVDESATSLLLGNATSRKTTSYDAVVRDWIRLSGIDTLKPAAQSDGDPRAQVNQNEVYRGDSTLRTSESITFNIAAQVVDIMPNGLIVLEGNTTMTLNDNSMEISLIGTCRSEDITPDNTVLSRNLVNKHIKKREDGHVRDGYSRGWLTRIFAKVKPF